MKTRLLALALLTAACSHAKHPPASPTSEPPTTVKIVNDNVVDMNVFVRSGGGPQFRLGRVAGGHTEVLTIPPALVHFQTTLFFEMRPVDGSARSRSQSITMNPGDHVTLMISP